MELSRLEIHELGKHIETSHNACCIQIFANPFQEPSGDIIGNAVAFFLNYYFNFPQAQLLYAVPEIHEHSQCRLLEQSGFSFYENLILPSKAASLYLITRKHFFTGTKMEYL